MNPVLDSGGLNALKANKKQYWDKSLPGYNQLAKLQRKVFASHVIVISKNKRHVPLSYFVTPIPKFVATILVLMLLYTSSYIARVYLLFSQTFCTIRQEKLIFSLEILIVYDWGWLVMWCLVVLGDEYLRTLYKFFIRRWIAVASYVYAISLTMHMNQFRQN